MAFRGPEGGSPCLLTSCRWPMQGSGRDIVQLGRAVAGW